MELDDDLRRQFAALGVATQEIPSAPAARAVVEVWRSNWPALRLFCAAGTQWRTASTMGGIGWIGLDYQAVELVERRLGLGPVAWADLQVMEEAALAVLNAGDT